MYGLLKKLHCACFATRTSPLAMTDKDIFEKVDSSVDRHDLLARLAMTERGVDRHTANAARDDSKGIAPCWL